MIKIHKLSLPTFSLSLPPSPLSLLTLKKPSNAYFMCLLVDRFSCSITLYQSWIINAGVLFATCQPVNSSLVCAMTTRQEKLVSSFGPRWDLHLEKCVHQGPAAAVMLMVLQKNGTLTLCWVSDVSLDLSVEVDWNTRLQWADLKRLDSARLQVSSLTIGS